jgi:lipid-binding SYLF domain-containing protein
MRTGLWFSGAGGAGILVAKLPDGSWSPPSGLMLHTAGLGFLVGVDIYDCVMVINTDEALQGFSKLRATVGGEMSAVAGPVGMGGVLDSEVHRRRAPIFTYLKSRGFYAGVQIDGTVLIERTDENEKFYGRKIPVMDILTGKVEHPPASINTLMKTIRAAQGDEVDWDQLPSGPPPSDFEIDDDGHLFGVPDKMDPDPYGVLALEKEGMQLKEAGTNKRASHEAFTFNPSPSSPVFQSFNRNSLDGRTSSMSRRSSWRTSVATVATTTAPSRPTSTTLDIATQTDFDGDTPLTSPTSFNSNGNRKMADIAEHSSFDAPTAAGTSTASTQSMPNGTHLETKGEAQPEDKKPEEEDERLDEADVEDEEPVVVQTVQTAATPQFINRARLVSVKKPNAPALPPRNPVRDRGKPLIIGTNNPRSESSQDEETSSHRPSTERTRSHDSMTSVDLTENKRDIDHKENDEFHSVTSTPAGGSPRLAPIDGVKQDVPVQTS